MRNRRKTYILDVLCNKFYFGEVQEEVLGQCSGQDSITANRREVLSVYQWSFPVLITLVSFLSGGCADDVVNNRTYYQLTLVIVIHFMNGTGICWIIRRAIFNVWICLNHS